MRTFLLRINLFVVAITTLVLATTRCTPAPEEQPQNNVAALSFETSTVEVAANGGEVIIDFTIAESYKDAAITPYCNEEWIEKIECLTSKILLTITANEEREERKTTIEFSCGGVLQQATLTIVQAANNSAEFIIAVESIEAKSCITIVTPADKDMEYVMFMSEASYFIDCDIVTPEQLIEDDKSYFKNGAEFDGTNLRDYMINSQVLFSGKQRTQWNGISPGILSIIYVYGVEFNEDKSDYTVVTPIIYEKIVPATAPINEAISFDISTEVHSADVVYNITSESWNGHFYVEALDYNNEQYIAEGEALPEGYTERIAEDWMYTCNYYTGVFGISNEDILAEFCYKGTASGQWELISDLEYMIIVYAVDVVDGVLQMVSRPTIHYLKTEKVVATGLNLDIKVENIYSHVCDLSITPSNDNEPYILLITPIDVVESATDDEALTRLILTELAPWTYTFRGKMSTHINTLIEETEYAVFAFGYYGGVVTTELFKSYFTTPKAEKGTNAVTEVVFNGPYDPVELANYNPDKYGAYYSYAGLYLMYMETITERATEDKFHMLVDTATYFYFGEDVIFSDLVAFVCDPVTVNHGYFNEEYIVVGAAMDERSNYSDMWKSESFTWYEEDMRPISELIEKIESVEQSASVTALSITPSRVYNDK